MKTISPIRSTLVHKALPSAGSVDRSPALILLHGRGADENDLLGLVPYLDPRFFVVSARAPFPFPYGGFAWYEIVELGTPESKEFDESYRLLAQFITDVKQQYPVDPERLFLLGFSMGAIMALAIALTQPASISGVVAHSGYIPENTSLSFRWDDLAGRSIMVAHGVHDPVIGIEYGRRANELLSRTAADFTYREYPIGHQISEESLSDLAAWLERRISGRTGT